MEVVPKKLFYQSKLSLEVDCYNFTSIFDIVITSTITIMNSTTTNVAQQWALLAKKLNSWKLKNHIATT
jgi:D-mannonate dehydratase